MGQLIKILINLLGGVIGNFISGSGQRFNHSIKNRLRLGGGIQNRSAGFFNNLQIDIFLAAAISGG